MHILPQYTLYIRRHDKAMQLIDGDTGKQISIRWIEFTTGTGKIEGIFVSPWRETGVFLMDDEVQIVEKFP